MGTTRKKRILSHEAKGYAVLSYSVGLAQRIFDLGVRTTGANSQFRMLVHLTPSLMGMGIVVSKILGCLKV